MKKNTRYVPIFIVAMLLQFLAFIIGVSLYDTNYDISLALGGLFFLLIPINLVLIVLILVNKVKKKKLNIRKNKLPPKNTLKPYVIEFPFYGVRCDEDVEEERYFEGKEAYECLNDSIIDAINISWNGSNMQNFVAEEELKKKLKDMQLFICKDGTCKIIISIFEELTAEEKEYLLEFVKGQASDGWGEGDFDFEDSNGKLFSVIFWKNDSNWYIKYRDDRKINLIIKSMESVNEIKFGMTRDEIHSLWGETEGFYKGEADILTDDYGFCHIYYDSNDLFEAIDIAAEYVDVYYENTILPEKYSDILSFFRNMYDDIEEHGNGFISKKGSIGVYIENDEDIVDAIVFGKKGCYLD